MRAHWRELLALVMVLIGSYLCLLAAFIISVPAGLALTGGALVAAGLLLDLGGKP